MSCNRVPGIVATVVFAAAFGAAGQAAAEPCGDKECPQGFTCVANTISVGAPTPACDAAIPECARPAPLPQETTYYSCEPKACTSDESCGAGMVCHEQTQSQCSGGGTIAPCPPDTVCETKPVVTETTCTTTSSRLCAFKWQLPCNVDADCGGGFTCQPAVSGSCSSPRPISGAAGSSGSGVAAGSGDTPVAASDGGAAEPNCTTTTSFPGYCQLKATTCTADSDCPTAWTCATIGTPSTGTGTAPEGRTTDAPTTTALPAPQPSVDGGVAPVTTTQMCVSFYGGFRDIAATSGPAGTSTPSVPGGGGTPAPSADDGSKSVAEASTSGGGEGCSVAAGTQAPGAALWTALALLGLLVGRKTRR